MDWGHLYFRVWPCFRFWLAEISFLSSRPRCDEAILAIRKQLDLESHGLCQSTLEISRDERIFAQSTPEISRKERRFASRAMHGTHQIPRLSPCGAPLDWQWRERYCPDQSSSRNSRTSHRASSRAVFTPPLIFRNRNALRGPFVQNPAERIRFRSSGVWSGVARVWSIRNERAG